MQKIVVVLIIYCLSRVKHSKGRLQMTISLIYTAGPLCFQMIYSTAHMQCFPPRPPVAFLIAHLQSILPALFYHSCFQAALWLLHLGSVF